jgi:ribosomal protein S27AE
MMDQCPGSVNIRMPRLELRPCPKCGDEIEIASNDASAKCSTCGFVIYNDTVSCVQWCEYAKECVGEKTYDRIMQQLAERQQDEE